MKLPIVPVSTKETTLSKSILSTARESPIQCFWDECYLPGALSPSCIVEIKRIFFMSASLSLVSELERLANTLDTDSSGTTKISLPSIAERIAKSMGVKTEEVAIMGLSMKWRHLHFLVPEALKNVGFIPLSSNSALAARTARESRPEINNSFVDSPHATVFERAKVGGEPGETIQKIISAPILSGERVVGIIQISRKGANATSAGPDFTSEDVAKVIALCKPLGKLLQHVVGE
jgi:hypothetical protein